MRTRLEAKEEEEHLQSWLAHGLLTMNSDCKHNFWCGQGSSLACGVPMRAVTEDVIGFETDNQGKSSVGYADGPVVLGR